MAKQRTGGQNANSGVGVIGGGAATGGGGGGGRMGATILANGRGVQMVLNGQSVTRTNTDNSLTWANHSDAEIRILRAKMQQTGDEAGRVTGMGDPSSIYVATSKSYLINNALRSDMKTLNGFMGERNQAGYWIRNGVNMNVVKGYIQKIDGGMKPLGKDMQLIRYENDGKAFGFDVSKLGKMNDAQLANALVGLSRESKSYVSTSYKMDANSSRDRAYLSKPIAIEYVARQGVDAVITNNKTEHEVLVGRGYTEQIVGARRVGSQIVLTVELDPSKRGAYYKV